VGWFIIAVIISPLIAGIILVLLPRKSNMLAEITALAAVEATPQGSQARQMFAARKAAEEKARRTGVMALCATAAIILVLIVVYVFLQGFRATIIPMLTVPVSLLGAFIALSSSKPCSIISSTASVRVRRQ